MPNQSLPARARCGVAFALLLLPAYAGCGQEREPWVGFDLFPAQAQPPDGTAGTDSTGDSTDTGGSAAPNQPIQTGTGMGTDSPGTPMSAANGGETTGGPAQPGESANAGAPGTSSSPNGPDNATPTGPATPFRITELQLRDPHVFAGTQDLTEQEVLGQSVNRTLIPAKLTKDADGDGSIDVSVIALLQPFDATAAPDKTPTLNFVNADCPVNGGANAACKPQQGAKGLDTTWNLEQRPSGNCLEPLAGTTSNYSPAVTVPSGPCFLSTNGIDLTMDLGGIKIKVTAARVGASYQAQPPGLVKGLVAGFVTRAAAMEAILPSDAGPMVAGDSLATYIRQRDYDQSSSPNGQDGFWMYLNFVAKPIMYTP